MDTKQLDIENLDAIIAKCEDGMISPFKKKKAAEPEPEAAEAGDEGEGDKPDLSDMDLDDLVSMYQDMKAGK
jgi:hypothetical protein